MITEIQFATNYPSTWRSILPNSEGVITRLNKTLENLDVVAYSVSKPVRRAFLNEIAFQLFAMMEVRNIRPNSPDYQQAMEIAVADARHSQSRYNHGGASEKDPTFLEVIEIKSLAEALKICRVRIGGTSQVVLNPSFHGCGILEQCRGDIIAGDTLIEVKAGDRRFRSLDVRQILVYCALNSVSTQYQIRSVSCVNPRRGVYFEVDLDTLCLQLASKASSEVLAEIVYYVSSREISR